MPDLYEILKLLKTEFPMDYCEEFDLINDFLEHCDKNVKPFKKVHFRGGHENFILDLTRGMQELLIARNLMDADSKEPLPTAHNMLRKITMYLLLNTDASYKYDLSDDSNICHCVGLCPQLPKFVVVALIWDLNLDRFLYEALSYTPCWFSFQFNEACSESLKYVSDPYTVLEKVEQLMRAITISTMRYELRTSDAIDCKIIFEKLYDYSMSLMRQFYTPDAEKFRDFTKDEFSKYSGYALKHLMQIVLHAFDAYEERFAVNPDFNIDIYEICQEACKPVLQIENKRLKSTVLKDQQLKIIWVMLNSLKYNFLLVKIDAFMLWVEIDLPQHKNLQLVIGELAYNINERIAANADFDHDVIKELKLMALRPKTLQEIVVDANMGEILRSLDEPLSVEQRKVWYDEIFNRPIAFGNDECLQTIENNIDLIDVQNCIKILNFIQLDSQRIKAESEDEEGDGKREEGKFLYSSYAALSALILRSLQMFESDQILQLLNHQLQLFGSSTQICRSTTNFKERAIRFLNQYGGAAIECSAANTSTFNWKQFLILCFEQPSQMWAKLFDSACHSTTHTSNFCIIVQRTRPFSDIYFEPLLKAALRDYTKTKLKYFPVLLCEIYMVLYMPDRKTEFLQQIVNKTIVSLLDEPHDFTILLSILKGLNLIATHGDTNSNKPVNFGEATAPVLMLVANSMDKARWDLATYSDIRDEVVCLCIKFIQRVSKRFLPVASEKDRKWIAKMVKDSYRPMTEFYFQKFALSRQQTPLDFDRFLIPQEITNKSEAEKILMKHYIRCTMRETEWLVSSVRLQPYITDVMLLLGGVVSDNAIPNATENYRHCLANFANIVHKILLPQIGNNTKSIENLVLDVLKIIGSSPAAIYEDTFVSFQSLLVEILHKLVLPVDDDVVEVVRNFVCAMRDCKGKEIFVEMFEEFVTKKESGAINEQVAT